MQIVLSGAGRNFCAGIDLAALEGQGLMQPPKGSDACEGRARMRFLSFVDMLQEAMTACERCSCPVIAAIHGACFGAGIDLTTACDIRFCTADAKFCVKEADLAITADMGTLARLPGIVGDGVARELALTARTFSGSEAQALHLVSATFPDRATLMQGAEAVASDIAGKSPLAVTGTKRVLLHARDHSVAENLEYVALFNAAALPGSKDLHEVFAAKAEGRVPKFSKL